MPGEPVVLAADRDGRIRAFVDALRGFPHDPSWVLVGGFAVNVRIAQVHRLTNDVDTVTVDQNQLMEVLLAGSGADRLGHGKLRLTGSEPAVDVDVMGDTSDERLPVGASDRAFSLARRRALATREVMEIVVVADGHVQSECAVPVATTAALIALKSVSLPRRTDSSHPEKVGSDIIDIARLVDGHDLEDLAGEITALGEPELTSWIHSTLAKWFQEDLRYTVARLRTLSSPIDSASIDTDMLALIGELGAALSDG